MSRSSPSASGSAAGGFTLLEVVVAFAILGLAFAAAYDVLTTGLRNVRVSGEYVTALLHAESKLATIGVVEPIVVGTTEGRLDDVYRWRLTAQPVLPPETEDPPPEAAPMLIALALDVYWGDDTDRKVTLESFRLMAKERR